MRRKLIGMILLSSFVCGSFGFTSCTKKESKPTVTTTVETSETTETSEETTSESLETDASGVDNSFTFDATNFPRLDGSTAMRPLGVGMYNLLVGGTREEAESAIWTFSTTDYAFYYLEDGWSDILIVAQPCQEVVDNLAKDGFEYDMEEIAMEGLVFVVNESNPVDSLTVEQVQKIYTGEITNWSEVGGNDEQIVAFQRPESSGSQVMMHECVMGDLELMDAPSEMVPAEMDDLIESVVAYNNAGNALGYTVYYYANNMRMADGLKILAIEGVEPSVETISSGEYPFLNPYYCVIPHDAAEDSSARILYNWLVSPDGQRLVALEGYAPLS